ncbi:HPr family phosphocarrier protein [Bifidobacterium aquikefiri]|uniref:Phosphocarrier protein HPr n=1 Tax=Bifidobacterium aquikefiri TaxID=1653207 RepID=A0A261GAM0_9BIFI|nr:HPr family phosphocarrier protein [Bifidobacterium aquikefiri]OZG68481.1 phosphotransferase [Bifidobacterium aquikefiri]
MSTATRTVEITDPVGIHARPASAFSQAAASSACTVTIAKKPDNASVDATSVLMIMSLGIKKGDTIEITVKGEDAENTADQLVQTLLQNK